MKKFIFTINSYISKFLFGSRCFGCQSFGVSICNKCLLLIPLSSATENEGVYALYSYGHKIVSHAVWGLKYKHRGQEAKLLVFKAEELVNEIIADALQSEVIQEITLVPVPQYKKKTQARGFNQSEIIAKWISQILPYSHIENILEKTIETKPQSHLSDRKQRLHNVEGVMKAKYKLDKNKIYIVIDDVTTTGATFLEAMRALKSGGAKNIICIALAHGYKRR